MLNLGRDAAQSHIEGVRISTISSSEQSSQTEKICAKIPVILRLVVLR